MDPWTVPVTLAWIVALLASRRVLRPHLLLALGMSQHRASSEGDGSDLLPADANTEYARKYKDLVANGFEPVGVIRSYAGQSLSCRQLMFCSREGDCVAEVMDRSYNLSLMSAFVSGVTVQSCNFSTIPFNVGKDIDLVRPDLSLSELLRQHRQAVADLEARGEILLRGTSLDQCSVVVHQVSTRPFVRIAFQILALIMIAALGTGLAVCWAAGMLFLPAPALAGPLSIVAGALLMDRNFRRSSLSMDPEPARLVSNPRLELPGSRSE